MTNFDLIDIKKIGSVNVSEWIYSMNKLLKNTNFDNDELLHRRMFYYIIMTCHFVDGNDDIHDRVNQEDIKRFIDKRKGNHLIERHPFNDVIKILNVKLYT